MDHTVLPANYTIPPSNYTIWLQLTTHLLTPKGWKAESTWLADLQQTITREQSAQKSAEMTSCDWSCDWVMCNTQFTTSRTNSTVRSTQSTTSQVTATVVRDAIPECLAHVTLIVASENLFLQWLVSAVRTERRIAGQTGHATSIKQHLVTNLFTGNKLLLREPVIITNHIPSPVYLLIPHSQ